RTLDASSGMAGRVPATDGAARRWGPGGLTPPTAGTLPSRVPASCLALAAAECKPPRGRGRPERAAGRQAARPRDEPETGPTIGTGSDEPHLVGLRALGALRHLELHLLVLLESPEAGRLDRRVVDEDIRLALALRDEAVALLSVEPFHGALCHVRS